MIIFKRATPNLKNELMNIMSLCFNESLKTVEFFFDNKVEFENCYVCIYNKKIVSLLHALPSEIRLNSHIFSAIYIYGACTLPLYRNKGYMKKLLKFAELQSKLKKTDYSILVPENQQLQSFYEKLGYKNFFKTQTITLTKKQLLLYATTCKTFKKTSYHSLTSYYFMENLRSNIYNKTNGVIYNVRDLEYAVSLYKKFGGTLISTKYGYAICSPAQFNTLEIRDFTCAENHISELLNKIFQMFSDFEKYIIHTNPNNSYFKDVHNVHSYGMIKSLNSKSQIFLNKFNNSTSYSAPYLGIALD